MDKDYSKREIDVYFEDVKQNFREVHETLGEIRKENSEIKAEVKATNGNVGALKAWRTGITMVIALIAFIVLPLIVYSFQLSQENLKHSILLELKK